MTEDTSWVGPARELTTEDIKKCARYMKKREILPCSLRGLFFQRRFVDEEGDEYVQIVGSPYLMRISSIWRWLIANFKQHIPKGVYRDDDFQPPPMLFSRFLGWKWYLRKSWFDNGMPWWWFNRDVLNASEDAPVRRWVAHVEFYVAVMSNRSVLVDWSSANDEAIV